MERQEIRVGSKPDKKKEMLFCPKCGAPHTLTAKFCRKDGTPLNHERKDLLETPVQQNISGKEGLNSSKKLNILSSSGMILLSFGLLIGLILSGVYFYLNLSLMSNPIKIEEDIISDLKKNGLDYLSVNINRDLIVTVKGIVNNPYDKDLALSLIKSRRDVKKVIDEISLITPFFVIEEKINNNLKESGIKDIYVNVDKDYIITINGTYNKYDDKNRAIRIIRSYKELKGLIDNTSLKKRDTSKYEKINPATIEGKYEEINPATIEGEINRAIRNSGIKGVFAEVEENLEITLKGSVMTVEDKDKIFQIADSFKDKGIKTIKDMVFVVEWLRELQKMLKKSPLIIIIILCFVYGCAKAKYEIIHEPSKINLVKPITELILLSPIITPDVVKAGDSVILEFQYSLPDIEQGILYKVSENITLANGIGVLSLKRIEHEKTPGLHLSRTQFVIPKNIYPGEYKIISTIDIGSQKKSVTGILRIE